jgi:spermidine/putrescine transport system substrate-binding protein
MKKTLIFMTILSLSLCLGFFPGVSPAVAGGEVVVYNWTEYMPDPILSQFTRETGINVVYATYESNETLYAKVKLMGAKGYDIIVPSSYFVSKMRREGLLAPLDKSKLTNLTNLDPALLDKPYDPQNRYSVPYMWGGTGLMVDSARIDPASVTSWRDLWNPAYRQAVLLQDDLREVFGIALALNGHSVNATDTDQIKASYELLTGLLPNVRLFNSDNPKMPYLNGEVTLGMIWNGEAFQAMEENPQLKFIWPKEGGIFWTDCLAIPKNAPNVENAHSFINFILRPDIAAQIAAEIGYATPNREAFKLLPEAVRNSPVAYPPNEVLHRSEFQNDIGEAIVVYEHYWEKLKTGQ